MAFSNLIQGAQQLHSASSLTPHNYNSEVLGRKKYTFLFPVSVIFSMQLWDSLSYLTNTNSNLLYNSDQVSAATGMKERSELQ